MFLAELLAMLWGTKKMSWLDGVKMGVCVITLLIEAREIRNFVVVIASL